MFASKRRDVVAGVCICAVLLSVVGWKVQWEDAKNSYGDSALKCIRPAIGCESTTLAVRAKRIEEPNGNATVRFVVRVLNMSWTTAALPPLSCQAAFSTIEREKLTFWIKAREKANQPNCYKHDSIAPKSWRTEEVTFQLPNAEPFTSLHSGKMNLLVADSMSGVVTSFEFDVSDAKGVSGK